MTPGDGSAAVPSEPRRWTIWVCPECGGLDDSPLPHRHGMGLKQHTVGKRSVTVEEVGPVSEAQVEAAARELHRQAIQQGLRREGEPWRGHFLTSARAVLSAAREVKSDV